MRGVNVAESAAYRKGAELVEDLREKYETSDHPMVHKVEVREGGRYRGPLLSVLPA